MECSHDFISMDSWFSSHLHRCMVNQRRSPALRTYGRTQVISKSSMLIVKETRVEQGSTEATGSRRMTRKQKFNTMIRANNHENEKHERDFVTKLKDHTRT
ncbi:hypothetical protein Droror1_Dr00000981 [Drosera rotundifolia]